VNVSERELRDSTTLFVGNLPYNFRERDVADYFGKCGRLRGVTIGMNRRTGQSKGYAFVEYESRRDAEDAYDRYILLNRHYKKSFLRDGS
jgi:RNA recognition motif-containing protein